MADPIGPGDWVECVDASPDVEGRPVPLAVGAVYCVEQVTMAADALGRLGPALALLGVDDFHLDFAARSMWIGVWSADRFRPIYRPDESLISRLLEPLPDCVEQVNA